QPSIPCPAWAGCTIATAGVRRRNREFELTGRLFDERSGCRASGVAVGATAADSDEACAPDFRRSPSCELLVRPRESSCVDRFSPLEECVAVCRFGIGYSQGFTASELAQQVRALSGEAEPAYGPRRAAYDLKKLRGKGMVRKIATSRRYEPEPDGLRAITALVVLRENIIRPLLAASQQPEPQTKANHPTPVDHYYEHLRLGMRDLFKALGIAA